MNIWRKIAKILGIFGRTPRRRNAHILIIGLNNAGKSTLLNRLKPEREQLASSNVGPTVGFAVDKFTFNNVKFTVHDMSGRDGYRSMWECMYGRCDALLFVVDSTDQMRLAVAKDELDMTLRHADVADRPSVPILFLASKAAAPDACSTTAVAAALRLHEDVGQSRPWRLAATDISTGRLDEDGLHEAMCWLVEQITKTAR
ncbi:ADP-ribosylation factor-like protein 6 [Adelges cooleyi]|uniref:ADP-ribosylation factor-like protein 6 n=1 Tax=Adelges cooleyi TaxID=133065 RepID=UPI00218043FD|nr:ADP-ribosylation factor-like protein 6 [Adelges cooleyi]